MQMAEWSRNAKAQSFSGIPCDDQEHIFYTADFLHAFSQLKLFYFVAAGTSHSHMLGESGPFKLDPHFYSQHSKPLTLIYLTLLMRQGIRFYNLQCEHTFGVFNAIIVWLLKL